MAHILIAGLGRLGSSLAQRLTQDGHQVTGIRRKPESIDGIDVIAQDLTADQIALPSNPIDLLYIILTPSQRTEAGYQDAFITSSSRLLDAISAKQNLPPIVFVSSTAVFGDVEGVVDENTPPKPDKFNGQILLAAENHIRQRGNACCVRFSGIYGRSSQRLQKQAVEFAQQKTLPAAKWTNRIHEQDCVGLLKVIGDQFLNGVSVPSIVVGTDNYSCPNIEVLSFLAKQQGLELPPVENNFVTGKQVKSCFIEEGHYTLLFPTFKQGYEA